MYELNIMQKPNNKSLDNNVTSCSSNNLFSWDILSTA